MNLQLISSKAAELTLSSLNESTDEGEEKAFHLNYTLSYDTGNESAFAVIFTISIFFPKEFKLDLKYVSWFKASEVIDDKFKNSHFPIINAPAIAYPFLRTFISNLTLNSGFTPVILPSVNFSEMGKEKFSKIEG